MIENLIYQRIFMKFERNFPRNSFAKSNIDRNLTNDGSRK